MLFSDTGDTCSVLYLIGAAAYDWRSHGLAIPTWYLNSAAAVSGVYFAYVTAVTRFDVPLTVPRLLTLGASILLAIFLYRTALLGHADLYALVTVTLLSPQLALEAFILASLTTLITWSMFALTVNRRRHDTRPFLHRLVSVRITPRLLQLPLLSWSKAYDHFGRLNAVFDAEHADMTVRIGEYGTLAYPLIPFFAAAEAVLVLAFLAGCQLPFFL
jgi:hypothetical protein